MTDAIPTSWEQLDPEALLIAQALTTAMPAPVHELGVATARELLASAPRDSPLTPLDRIDELTVPTRTGRARARRYHPPAPQIQGPQPTLLYLHGGGFVLGTLDGVDEVCRAIAARSGWGVVSLEYRLAPEHPYPAALHDAIDALTWLRGSAQELDIDPGAIAVGGDSAGGNLAAGLCLHLRDAGLPPPAAQVLVYPAVDDQFSTPSWELFADAPLLTAADARWFWEQYLGPDQEGRVEPYAAPMKAESLRGLPPALVLTAHVDPLRDDAEAFAERLHQAGVTTTSIRYPGVFHGFFTEVGVFAQTDTAIDDVVRHLRAVVTAHGIPTVST